MLGLLLFPPPLLTELPPPLPPPQPVSKIEETRMDRRVFFKIINSI